MSTPLLLLVLNLAFAPDAGTPTIAPVTSAPGSHAAADATTKAVDPSQLPFTPDSISQVVRAHQPEIQGCYEKMLAARQETVQGRLMTHFTITPAGTVSGAQVEKHGSTLNDKGLNACVVGVLGKLHFPKPPSAKGYPVEYPFNLKAVE